MLILLGVFLLLLILNVPVSFSLFISSMLYMFIHDISPLVAVQRILAGPNSFALLAVPGFVLAAGIMNTGGITKRIFDFADKLTGHYRGGLAHANILASIFFAGMSGAAVADAAGLGKVELEAMKNAGYDDDFSLAITGASSTIGPIIPPSVPAVLFGVVAGVSVGRLFVAGIIPGLIMGIALGIAAFFTVKKRKYPRKKKASPKELWDAFRHSFFSLLSPVLIMGGILGGIFTPTEASVIMVGSAESFVYRLNCRIMSEGCDDRVNPRHLLLR